MRNSSSSLSLVLFDCDGTLVDSLSLIGLAMNLAYEGEGFEAPPFEAVRNIIGLSLHSAIEELSPECTREEVERLSEAYKQNYVLARDQMGETEPLFDGAKELIVDLAAKDNVLLGLATGKSNKGVERLLAREELEGYFHTIQTADTAPSKPHPGMIENAISETGVCTSGILMIGDTYYDMEMARNGGVKAVGVSWGYHETEQLAASGADEIVNDFRALERVIKDHCSR